MPTRQDEPDERLCEFVRATDSALMAIDLRFGGESSGWEVRLLERERLLMSRGGFPLRENAIAWATDVRNIVEKSAGSSTQVAPAYRRDDERRRLWVTLAGNATIDDVLVLMDRHVAEGAWSYSMLYDLRGITFAPSLTEVERALNRVQTLNRKHGPRGPLAFVTAVQVTFGVGRMYSMLGEGRGLCIGVFKSRSEAERWLDEEERAVQ